MAEAQESQLLTEPSTSADGLVKEKDATNAENAADTINSPVKKSKLRRLKSEVMRNFTSAKQHSYEWFHKKLLPKLPVGAQSFVAKFENTVALIYEYYWRFMIMPQAKKLLIIGICFMTGATGFCVSLPLYQS